MTVDSEIFMPKSKAPKMDDLDYSKWGFLISCPRLVVAGGSA